MVAIVFDLCLSGWFSQSTTSMPLWITPPRDWTADGMSTLFSTILNLSLHDECPIPLLMEVSSPRPLWIAPPVGSIANGMSPSIGRWPSKFDLWPSCWPANLGAPTQSPTLMPLWMSLPLDCTAYGMSPPIGWWLSWGTTYYDTSLGFSVILIRFIENFKKFSLKVPKDLHQSKYRWMDGYECMDLKRFSLRASSKQIIFFNFYSREFNLFLLFFHSLSYSLILRFYIFSTHHLFQKIFTHFSSILFFKLN